MYRDIDVSTLVGKTMVEVRADDNIDVIFFKEDNGTEYQMYHSQDCCESVMIEDINGDLDDLVGAPIMVAEERNSEDRSKEQEMTDLLEMKDMYNPSDSGEDLWTFYEFRTIKGSVNIRWHGSSNGYYSMSVSFEKVGEEDG